MKIRSIMATNNLSSIILIRMIVGAVFLSEGIQKFIYPDVLGIGRFIRIGIPAPAFFAPFVGIVEIIFGFLIIIGLLTRVAAIPLIINISVAIISSKIPILINQGFWKMAHEARTDFSMLFGLIFLLIVGAGKISLDYVLKFKNKEARNV
jgi:putative oxidoreductase